MTTAAELKASLGSLEKSVMRMRDQRDKLITLARIVVAGMDEDPGHSDLDDEQPIHVSMTLGDYRRAKRLLWDLEQK